MERFLHSLGYEFNNVYSPIHRRLNREEALLFIGEMIFSGVDEAIGAADIEAANGDIYVKFHSVSNIDEEKIAAWIHGLTITEPVTKNGRQYNIDDLCDRNEAMLAFQMLTNSYLD